MTDRDVAMLMRREGADIAIDLMGYTEDARPGILALRPAPVQVNYLGYPGTMGAGFIDYIVADRFLIPTEAEQFYAERVVRMPHSYQVNDGKRPIAARTPTRSECGLPERGFVFCCFNNHFKITPEVFAVWMRLLRRVEGSVLWLLQGDAAMERNLRREAQAHGVDASRLVFAARANLPEHLARHRLADLFVDTLPYNAHTTSSDALWAGLPVLTCAGRTFAARVAGSLLHAVGLPELVTESLDAYEREALALAAEPQRLAALRARLASNRDRCPLFDTDRFRRDVEAAYATMWAIHWRGEEPRGFAVSAQGA
jgi:predicted O-linked N-acetylglucosamine transferase (SPINDLY family)